MTERDDQAEDETSVEDATPGPEPTRLVLPDKDWKDALRRALEGDCPAEEARSEGDEHDENDGRACGV
jgi:hypothetical protein